MMKTVIELLTFLFLTIFNVASIVEAAATATTLTSSQNPSINLVAITLTATVTGGTPTGSVQFFDGSTLLGSSNLNAAGKANFVTGSLSIGAHQLTAFYTGDVDDSTSTSAAITQRVTRATSVALVSSNNPSAFNSAVTFTATLTNLNGAAIPTGAVDFLVDGVVSAPNAALVNGVASFTLSSLSIGSHTITGNFLGNNNFGPSTKSIIQTVRVATGNVLTSNLNPSNFGQPVTFTATITGNTPGGNVEFYDGTTLLSSNAVSLSGGVYRAQTTVTSLSVGSHTITATYLGDTNNAPSTVTLNQVVLGTTTVLTSNVNPSSFGTPVTFTITVTGNNPTGSVQLKDGSTLLQSISISGAGPANSISFTTSDLALGNHNIKAFYLGDTNDAASNSGVLVQSVLQPTTTTLVSSLSPAGFGEVVTFTVTTTGINPSGNVQLLSDGDVISTLAVGFGGVTVFSISTLNVGDHNIQAKYVGDTNDAPSSSNVLVQTIRGTTVVLTSNLNPSTLGSTVIFSVQVVGTSPVNGNIYFFVDGNLVTVNALNGVGATSFSINTLTAGTHSISANYPGNASNKPASATITQRVRKPTSVVIISSLNPSLENQEVTFTATVNGINPTGNIEFRRGLTLLSRVALPPGLNYASFSIRTLPTGNNGIRAVYLGDNNDADSTSNTLQQIVQVSTTTILTSNGSPALVGNNVDFTATVTGVNPQGNVEFRNAGNVLLGTRALPTATSNSKDVILTLNNLPVGDNVITAFYLGGGTTNNAPSTSAPYTQRIRR